MPTGVLIDTTNRLLGWSTGDVGLYGAMPAVTIGAPHTPADPSLLTVPSATPPLVSLAQPAASQTVPVAPPVEGSTAPIVPDATHGAAMFALHTPVSDAASLAPQVASPVGSGSTAPLMADTAIPASLATADDGAAGLTGGYSANSLAAPVFAATEAASTSLIALAPAILALATPAFAIPTETIGGVVAALAPANDTVAAGTQLLDGVIHDTALPAVEASVAAIADVLPDTHALADTGAGLAAAASDTVADAGAETAAIVTATVDTLAGTGASAANAASTAVADAGAAVANAAETTIDTLAGTGTGLTATALPQDILADDPLGGTDPTGGVTTLVSMVATADLFEVVPSATDTPAIATGGSIVDTLAADALPDALLGDAAHHATDGLVPHHDDHGGLGL